jgi:predicted acyl esterase
MTPTAEEYAGLNIPVLTIAGYFDADQSGAMHYFKKHNESNESANHYLVLGPYDHLGLQQLAMPTTVGGYDLD